MVIAAAAQKADRVIGGCVPSGEFADVLLEFHLAERFGHVQRSIELKRLRDGREEVVHGRDADLLKHRLAVGFGVKNVRQGRTPFQSREKQQAGSSGLGLWGLYEVVRGGAMN